MPTPQYEVQNVLKRAQELDISTQFQPYSGVEIVVDEDTSYTAGDATGRVLTIQNPWGTQAQANNILTQIRGFAYQPYEAHGALVDPSAELGDGVSVNDVYSGIYKIDRNYSSLMDADISAPQSEEIDHEYPYESKQDRELVRRFSAIESEFSIQSNEIAAKVSKTSPSGQTSFSWSLQNDSWTIKSNGTTIFKVTASGAEVNGKITATSGYIGSASSGFTISSFNYGSGWNIKSGMDYLWDEAHNGVYLGTNGISVGGAKFVADSQGRVWASNLTITGGSITLGSNFNVTSSGNVTANNMVLKGTLTVGDSTITANDLRVGANRANTWVSNGTTSTWTMGANNGNTAKNNWDNATSRTGSYPEVFRAKYLVGIMTVESNNGLFAEINSKVISWKQVTIGGETFYVLKGV